MKVILQKLSGSDGALWRASLSRFLILPGLPVSANSDGYSDKGRAPPFSGNALLFHLRFISALINGLKYESRDEQ